MHGLPSPSTETLSLMSVVCLVWMGSWMFMLVELCVSCHCQCRHGMRQSLTHTLYIVAFYSVQV